MMDNAVDTLIRNWGLVALRGVAALVFGVITIARPAASVTVLVLLYGSFALVSGLFTIVNAVRERGGETHWIALLVNGVLSALLGVLTFFMPGMTALFLLYMIAGWAIVTGVAQIVTAVRLRRVISGEWMLVLAGVMSIVFGILVAVFPGAGVLAVTLWVGVYAILLGILLIALALRLRSWSESHGAARPAAPART